MERSIKTRLTVLALSIGTLGAVGLYTAPAAAQYEQIPVEVVATLTPVYHEGHAVYFWHNHWHYRNGTTWGYYTHPGFLHDHMHYVPVYHHYR